MEYKQIQELIKMINKSNISEFSIKDEDFELVIKQNSPVEYVAPVAPVAMAHAVPASTYVAAPAPAPAPAPAAAPAAQPAAPATPASSNDESKYVTIKSPMIGTFYRSPGPDKAPFVNVGDDVTTGKVVCIIEAMKLFNEIESEVNGKIVKVLVDDASPIEYDQPLFLVDPA
jgi:acetyl-CoA carboxylase biotin carboxyl carrier protein